jgi:hypothetical protein
MKGQKKEGVPRSTPEILLFLMDEVLEEFKVFLQTAPVNFKVNEQIKRFQLPSGDFISCVLWNELFHITGTDIVKTIQFRFESMGTTH